MKYGVREICDVVLRAKARMKVGNKVFYKNEPVIYFDTLKTSSLEGSASTSYATGGRGNTRLMSWDGERTVTFTMEDALISPEGFMILSGAGLVDATSAAPVYQHITERISKDSVTIADLTGADADTPDKGACATLTLSEKPYIPTGAGDNFAYVFLVKEGEIISEPIIPIHNSSNSAKELTISEYHVCYVANTNLTWAGNSPEIKNQYSAPGWDDVDFDSFLVDYYTERVSGVKQINITPDSFGGSFYLEASTLFRSEDGIDYPAEFIIPNCRIQSNFNFSMSSSGDPSTFTFTMDAFPDYTRFDPTKKVLASIQIIELDNEGGNFEAHRGATPANGSWAASSATGNDGHETYDDGEYSTDNHV